MSQLGRLVIVAAALIGGGGCGFGTYDGSSNPEVTSSASGVADAGQWWPWVCPDGIYPIPASIPQDYTATGSCGPGGPFTLSVDGCVMFGSWSVLGLSDVETTQPTSSPNLGGWILSATGTVGDGGVDLGDGGSCTATPGATTGVLTFTCSVGAPPKSACRSTLTPVGGT